MYQGTAACSGAAEGCKRRPPYDTPLRQIIENRKGCSYTLLWADRFPFRFCIEFQDNTGLRSHCYSEPLDAVEGNADCR